MKRSLLTPLAGIQPKKPNADTNKLVFECVFRKKQFKKHKTWDGDGTLVVTSDSLKLLDDQGKELGAIKNKFGFAVEPGQEFCFGTRDVQLGDMIQGENSFPLVNSANASVPKAHLPTLKGRLPLPRSTGTIAPARPPITNTVTTKSTATAANAPLVKPLLQNSNRFISPLSQENPVFLSSTVKIDPILTKHLLPHQIEGVQFLYECVMGIKNPGFNGAILADEMGLGKTLQSITLVWTLLKTSISGLKPIATKVLVLCPATLLANWKKEFLKWLGIERIKVFVCDENADLNDFVNGKVHQVMICSYEKLRKYCDYIQKSNFDLVICDEGHRLKNSATGTSKAVSSLGVARKIVLTGTPIQNDLTEFYNMCDFCNPGILGTLGEFKSKFSSSCQETLTRLTEATSNFVLRRTQKVNENYLPPKKEMVLFCKLTETQREIYAELSELDQDYLVGLSRLKKLVNSPQLLKNELEAENLCELPMLSVAEKTILQTDSSAKLDLLYHFILELKKNEPSDRLVIVSNYTETLDLIERMMNELDASFLRLDGKTPIQKRQENVDAFNRNPLIFAFLLSSKAGGVGLNLVGANRLVLFDIDWNPSVCLQAMARIYRQGQTKNVFIYRFLTVGTIEEKIFQRQLTKQAVSDVVLDDKKMLQQFSKEELQDLFSFNPEHSFLYSIPGYSEATLDLDLTKYVEFTLVKE